MNIMVENVLVANIVFFVIFAVALIASTRKKDGIGVLSLSVTQELKGVALLGVVFSHIGYFLVTDHQFLFPLSIIAGISVDLFLFLSGFGLTMSMLKKEFVRIEFYKKNFLKLYIPLWISLVIFFILSFAVAGIYYDIPYILKSLLGIFTTADIYHDINSPLWYFTMIIFYYLLFLILFSKKYPWVSAIEIFLITLFITKLNPPTFIGVNGLQSLHILAFPVGILIGSIYEKIIPILKNKSSYLYSGLSIIIFCICAYYSGKVSDIYIQQIVNIIAILSLIFVFSVKKVHVGILSLLGIYSYEIYLIHWPILYHYDIFYRYTPAWLATTIYIALFIWLGSLLKKASALITKN